MRVLTGIVLLRLSALFILFAEVVIFALFGSLRTMIFPFGIELLFVNIIPAEPCDDAFDASDLALYEFCFLNNGRLFAVIFMLLLFGMDEAGVLDLLLFGESVDGDNTLGVNDFGGVNDCALSLLFCLEMDFGLFINSFFFAFLRLFKLPNN